MDDRHDLLDRLGQLARDHVGPDDSPADDYAAEQRLATAVARSDVRARRGIRTWALAAAAVLLGTALLVLWPREAITYKLEGAVLQETGYVRAGPDARAAVRFSEGSTVSVTSGASLRIAETDARGARLMLEAGQVGVEVVPRAHNRWSVEAGPFAVLVTGTRFDVAWDAHQELFEVLLYDGTVTVRGPSPNQATPLAAGQRLTARPRSGEIRVAPLNEPLSAQSGDQHVAPRPTDAVPAESEPPPSSGEASGVKPPAPKASWAKRVAAGDFAGVLADAEAQGVDAVLDTASLGDLTALGDAARYAGRAEVARRALTATRSRFGGSPQAHTAAFLLGRLADDAGSSRTALQWYDTYLAESPSGTFAAEALGKKMLAIEHASGANARSIAEEYLKRFPQGAHAARARQILGKE